MPRLMSVEELESFRAELRAARDPKRPCLTVCAGSGCTAAGAHDVLAGLRKMLEKHGLQDAIDLKSTGCHGFCERGPLMIVWPEGTFYNQVVASDASAIVASVSNGHVPVEKLLYRDPVSGKRVIHEEEVPFYARQQRVLFGNNGKIDPKDIKDYLHVGGYAALARVLEHEPRADRGRGHPLRVAGARGRRFPHRRQVEGVQRKSRAPLPHLQRR